MNEEQSKQVMDLTEKILDITTGHEMEVVMVAFGNAVGNVVGRAKHDMPQMDEGEPIQMVAGLAISVAQHMRALYASGDMTPPRKH